MQRLLIIDGSSLLSSCYYGNLPPEIKFNKDLEKEASLYSMILQTDGIYTNGSYSFMVKLEKMIEEQKPTHLAVVFDRTRNTFRRKIYPDYKGTRKETPVPLRMQKEYLPPMLSQMGIKTFWSDQVEGDDIAGSLAVRFCKEINTVILTGDKDLLQLVRPGIQIWYMTHSEKKAQEMFYDYTQGNNATSLSAYNLPEAVFPYGTDSVKWDKGVAPSAIPDLKGLSGDTSDNIPGVKGVSESKAAILLQNYGCFEALYQWLGKHEEKEIKKIWKEELRMDRAPVKALLADGAKENALLSKRLATILTNLEFPISLDDLRININQNARQQAYKKLKFNSLLKKSA